MPSQQPPPPHLLLTPKINSSSMDREWDRDSIGSSTGPTMNHNINNNNNNNNNNASSPSSSSPQWTSQSRSSSSTTTTTSAASAAISSSLGPHSPGLVTMSSSFSPSSSSSSSFHTASLQDTTSGGFIPSSSSSPALRTSTSRSLESTERRHASLTNTSDIRTSDRITATIDRPTTSYSTSTMSYPQTQAHTQVHIPSSQSQQHRHYPHHLQQHTHSTTPRSSSSITNSHLNSPEPRHRQRTHSSQGRSKLQTPSVQLALADPALSKSLSSSPAPSRSGSEQDQQAQAKRSFEHNVRRYYYQLTIGCQLPACTNKLCRSCKLAPRMTKDAAAILSIQLAARPRLFFCSNCPQDPTIQVPDSPIPATPLANANGRPPSLQKSRGFTSNSTTTRVMNSTHSSKSSPGPAASVEDFGHTKSRLMYDPNEYSKSVPSFSAARLLSPSTHPRRRRVAGYSHELPVDTKNHPSSTTLPPSSASEEQNGTPLFRSLLSLSPFSHMFSSGSSATLSKSQELGRKRSSPTYHIKKSASTSEMPDNGRPSRKSPDPSSIGFPRSLGGFHSIIHVRSFSPTRSISPPGSPLSPPPSLPDTTRFRTSSRIDDSPYGIDAYELPGPPGPVTCQGDESVGLGYTSRTLNSQRVLDLSRYYNTPSVSPFAAGSTTSTPVQRSRKQHRNNTGQGRDENPIPRPLFGTLHDPDSDGSASSSSTEDEPGKLGDPTWRGSPFHNHQHSYSHQHRSFSSGSAALSTVSPPQSPLEKELDSRTLYSFTRTRLRRDSSSSVSSEGEPVAPAMPWSSIHPIPSSVGSVRRSSSTSSLSSTPSSRRSSMGESDVGIALPYLNLTLLRQAIETYNASKPESPPRSPPSLTLKDFKPIHPAAWRLSLDFWGDQDSSVPERVDFEQGAESADVIGTHDASLQGDFKQAETADRNTELSGNGTVTLEAHSGANKDLKENVIPAQSDPATIVQDVISPKPAMTIRVKDTGRTSNIASPARSAVSSGLCSSEGDSTFLLDSLKSVFSSATALGSSFLIRDREDRSFLGLEPSGGVNVGGLDLEALRECYEMMIELKPRTIFAIQVTNSIEILIARMELEMEMDQGRTKGRKVWSEEEMRSIIILLMNPFLFDQPYQETLLRRILLIFIAFPDKTKLTQWLSCMDDEGMAQLVTLFKMYLSAHFSPRPQGAAHPAICAVKGLSILYQANNIGTKREQEKRRRTAIQDAKDGKQRTGSLETNSTISFKYFYSGVMEALKFKDEYQIWRNGWDKSAQEKQFSYFDYPFLLSPTSKSHIMNLDALTQMSAHYEDACVRHALADHAQRLLPDSMTASAREFQKGIRAASSPYLVLELTRGRLVEEAFEQITKKHADLKKPLKVAFVDVGEEGMDQGGVTKEFFQIMVEKVFDSQFGLFKELEEGRSWWFEGMMDGSSHVEMSSKDARVRLVEYELVGILVGLALYNGVILGVRFPSVVYRKLLGWEVELDSFIESFPALGNGLEQMLTWTDGDVYDVFMREFEISYEHLGQVTTLPLIPGGQDIPVTNDNRDEYVKAYVDHYLHEHIRQEFAAFQRGFEKICGGEALKLLRPEELELLLCGNADLDMRDLEVSCLYDDGYNPSHTLIKEFWEIVHEDLSPEQHKELLVFVTGSDRVPIRGLKDMIFVIQRNGPDSDRLPTALTCFSRLLLPEYANKEKMKERLVTAIENSNGFGLV